MKTFPDDIYQALPCFSKYSERVLIIAGNEAEDLSFFYPYYRFIEEGLDVDVATAAGGSFRGKSGLGLLNSIKISSVAIEDYDLLYISDSEISPNQPMDENILEFLRNFAATGKHIISSCRGPRILAAAGVIDGCKITAWPDVQQDVEDAGGSYINQKTVAEGQFLTARWPADLPSLMASTMKTLRSREVFSIKRVA